MRVSLTPEKAVKVKLACQAILEHATPSIRDAAKVLGLLTSSFPGVLLGPLHYRWQDPGS